jgi:Tol biopolymer transport system component
MRTLLGLLVLAVAFTVSAAGSTPAARILFEENVNSSLDLVTLDADATGYRDLTPGQQTFYASDQDGSWSPDGSRIVFASHRNSNVSTEIYVMDGDGSMVRRLTNDGPNGVQSTSAEVFDHAPVWSPSGGTIAYLKSVRGMVDVWLMRPDGSDQRQLTSDGGNKASLAWSPDGARVTYETGGAVFAVPGGDGLRVRLAEGAGLAWSPDGRRIAYVNAEGLWVAGADGRDPTRASTMPAGSPSWSPDGSRIAFVGTRVYPELASKFGAPARQDVYTVQPDGSGLRRLTGPRGEEYSPLPQGGYVPTWWPDSSRLFFESSQRAPGESATTYVMNVDGSCEGRFAQTPIQLRRPLWRPGSQPRLGPIRCADLRVKAESIGGYVGPAALGQASPFRFDIDNDGNETATGVRVELKTTAAQVEILGGSAGTTPCSGPRLDLVCLLPPVPPGSVSSVTFLVRSPVAGIFPLSVAVSALEPDTDPSTNTMPLSTQVLPCTKTGTFGADLLYGTPRRDLICALPGADRVYGRAGNDYLDAGNGNDVVLGGPGRDEIVAKGGNDTIYARDGERDTIDCGSERDVAVVDRLDIVSHCETVVRSRR